MKKVLYVGNTEQDLKTLQTYFEVDQIDLIQIGEFLDQCVTDTFDPDYFLVFSNISWGDEVSQGYQLGIISAVYPTLSSRHAGVDQTLMRKTILGNWSPNHPEMLDELAEVDHSQPEEMIADIKSVLEKHHA